MIFDTHAHLDNPEFDIDRDELISQIHASGVTNIMNIGADMKTSAASVKLANDYDFIYASVGVHPSEVHGMTNENLDELIKMAENPKVKAIGEIGLDYHYENIEKSEQKEWFIRQLELAKSIDMPVIIHDRDSSGDCLKILKEQKISDGVMHCFSGSAETAKNLVDMGFMISFTGVLTFKNAKRAVMACREIPLSRLMIETDCPYMSPEPHRGVRNHSGYVIHVAQKMAELKGVSLEEICEITDKNAKRFYRI